MTINRLLLLLVLVVAPSMMCAQQTFLTFLHNSSDSTLKEVDVYVTQSGYTVKVDNLSYQKADNLNTAIVFGGIDCYIDVAPMNSTSKDQAIATLGFMPEADAGYEIELRGLTGDGWVANPDGEPLTLRVSQKLIPIVDPVIGEVSALMSHGATDLEACDVYVRGSSTPLFTNLKYGQYTDSYKQLKRQRQTFDLTKAGDKTKVLASFEADLSLISSDVIVLTISGFKTPKDNHESKNELTLLAVLEDGSVLRFPLLSGSQTARVQVIHNSADPQLAVIDVYVNGTKAIDNLAFRKATSFSDYEAGTEVKLTFTPASGTGIKDSIKTITLEQFRPGRSYSLVIQGVLDTSKFNARGTSGDISLVVLQNEAALEQGPTDDATSIRAVHGVIDLGAVDLTVGSTSLGGNMAFNSVAPEYITMTGTQSDTIWALQAGTNTRIRGWVADLRGSKRAVVAALSGFFGPDSNMKGEPYKLILIDANGVVNDRLLAVDPTPDFVAELVPSSTWSLAPNPTSTHARLSIPLNAVASQRIGQGAWARVIDVTGTIVAEYALTIGADQITGDVPTSVLPSGMYQMYVSTTSGAFIGSTSLRVLR